MPPVAEREAIPVLGENALEHLVRHMVVVVWIVLPPEEDRIVFRRRRIHMDIHITIQVITTVTIHIRIRILSPTVTLIKHRRRRRTRIRCIIINTSILLTHMRTRILINMDINILAIRTSMSFIIMHLLLLVEKMSSAHPRVVLILLPNARESETGLWRGKGIESVREIERWLVRFTLRSLIVNNRIDIPLILLRLLAGRVEVVIVGGGIPGKSLGQEM